MDEDRKNDLKVVSGNYEEREFTLSYPEIPPTMLTIKETAKRTGLAEYYIRNLVWERKIPFLPVGKKYLINLEGLTNYLIATSQNMVTRPQ